MSIKVKTPTGTVTVAGNVAPTVIDEELSADSKNPVQNAAITAAITKTENMFGGIRFSVTESGLVRASWEDKEGE